MQVHNVSVQSEWKFSQTEIKYLYSYMYINILKISILCNYRYISTQFPGTIFKKCINSASTYFEYIYIFWFI